MAIYGWWLQKLWNSKKKLKSKLAKISLFFTKTFRKIMKRNPYFHEEEKIEFFWKKVSFEYFWSSSYHTRDKYKKYFHTKYLLNETFYIFCFFLLIFHDSCWGFYKFSFGFFNFFILFQSYFLQIIQFCSKFDKIQWNSDISFRFQ